MFPTITAILSLVVTLRCSVTDFKMLVMLNEIELNKNKFKQKNINMNSDDTTLIEV